MCSGFGLMITSKLIRIYFLSRVNHNSTLTLLQTTIVRLIFNSIFRGFGAEILKIKSKKKSD